MNLKKVAFIFISVFGWLFSSLHAYAASVDIRITEIMYDAQGSDTGHEWVELWNGGNEAVTIVGGSGAGSWRFNDGANHTFATSAYRGSLILAPGDFLIISSNTDTFLNDHPNFSGNLVKVSFSLGNTSETLLLRIETNGAPWSEVSYTNSLAAGNGKTLEWNQVTNVWQESVTLGGTPGSFPTNNSAPSPPPETPPQPEPTPEPQPASEPSPTPASPEHGQTTNNNQPSYDLTADLRISEFLPDPTGSDMEEWIEIWNPMSRVADLTGWKLDDGEGGSNSYVFPVGAQIQPGAYEIFSRRLTGLQLNNDLDSVRLIRPDGTIKDEVVYGESPEGSAYAKNGIVWKWTISPTPGAENVFPVAKTAQIESQEPLENDREEELASSENQSSQSGIPFAVEVKSKKQETKSKKQGKYIFEGIVTVPPGVLGTQIFYAQNNSRGLQIYMNSKDFPEIARGTRVRVSGNLGVAYGEERLKVKVKEDIAVTSQGEEIPPEETRIEDLKAEDVGKLFLVKGEAVDVSRGKIIVAHEDGDDELEVVWKSGAGDMPEVFPGDKVSVTGILKKNKSGFQILPRDEGDLVVEVKTQEEAVAPKRSRRRNWFVYVFGAASVFLSVGIMIQKRNKKLSV